MFSMALESKGFGYDKDRTFYMELNFSNKDYVIMVITLVVVLFSIYAKIKYRL